MRKFLNKLWAIITAPFRLIWKIISFPFKGIKKINNFLNEIPEENSLIDTTASAIQSADTRASLMDHVEVLRKHIFRALLALLVTSSISFAFAIKLLDYLTEPIGGISQLQAITPTEQIGVFMQVALISGVVLAMPYIAFEFWLFLAPALKPRAKKFGILGIPLATILFIVGVAFSFVVLLPPALDFLLGFLETQNNWTLSEYTRFVTNIMFWIGVFFELPLLVYALSSAGVLNPRVLQEQWRIAVVIITILAAAITPTIDPLNMMLVAIPMTLLYFISIGAGYIAYNARKRQKE
ncbi:MAG: twin-arginine translocase subunit TatC [Chloroflexi bacterium]|nr:twin-arginine translocase subunit TatC [Chloroflexota bacterium]